jgi:iron complex outermembrane recepter protein
VAVLEPIARWQKNRQIWTSGRRWLATFAPAGSVVPRIGVVILVLAVTAHDAGAQRKDPRVPLVALKKLSVEELMNIEIISVSRRPEKLSDAASAIQVVTGNEIRRSGASSIPEALRLADNLQVAQKNSHDWGISARGFNTELANKLLVMIDGRTVYTPLFSGVFWHAQDYLLEDLDRIEVISGPGGALWGANAVNGVINILSKNARETPGLYLEAGGGSKLDAFAGVRYGGTLAPNVHYRIYGRHFDRDHEVLSNGARASDSWDMSQGGFRIDAEALPQSTFTLQGDLYRGHGSIPFGGEAKFDGGNILGRWSQTFSDESDISLQVYYDHTYLYDPITNQFGTAMVLTDELDTYDLDFQHRFRLSEHHQIVWGVGYRFTHNVVNPAPNLAFLPGRLDHKLFSGFVQDEMSLGSNVSLTLGTKLEHNDYTGLEAEPSARVQWKLSPDKLLWSAVSRAVRTPSRIERDAYQPKPPPAILVGNPNFASETVVAYELGYRAAVGANASLSIAAFYNKYDDLRGVSFTPATIVPLFFDNAVEGESHGIEVTAAYQVLNWWRIRSGYNLLKSHLHVKTGRTDLTNALNETSDPEHQFSLRSSMDLFRRVEFDAALRWVDSLRNNNNGVPGTVPSYCELDLRIGWRVTGQFEVSIVGQNLLHDQHPEFGVEGLFREQIRRSVYGKITWRF